MKTCILAALLLLAGCAGGPDPIRLQSERASHALATRCADGWFQGLPWTPEDERLVRLSLADWQRAIEADAKLLEPTLPGGAK